MTWTPEREAQLRKLDGLDANQLAEVWSEMDRLRRIVEAADAMLDGMNGQTPDHAPHCTSRERKDYDGECLGGDECACGNATPCDEADDYGDECYRCDWRRAADAYDAARGTP